MRLSVIYPKLHGAWYKIKALIRPEYLFNELQNHQTKGHILSIYGMLASLTSPNLMPAFTQITDGQIKLLNASNNGFFGCNNDITF